MFMEIINLTAQERNKGLKVSNGTNTINIEVLRSKCKDVLLELAGVITKQGDKPMQRYLPQIKVKDVKLLRFMMNDFSTKPIGI